MQGRNRKHDSMVDVDDDEELVKYDKIPVSKNKEKLKLSENPPVYVFMKPSVKRCSGCHVLFDPVHQKPPYDLIFRYVTCGQVGHKRHTWKLLLSHPGFAVFEEGTCSGRC